MAISDLTDKLFKFLNEKGYVPISVPQGKMEPPTAYVLEGDTFHVLRSRENLLAGKASAPGLDVQEAPAADLEQAMANKGSGKASVSFLSGVLSKFGLGGAPEGRAELAMGDSRQFAFKKVTSRRVDPGAVLDALDGYDPAKFGVKHLEAGKVHIAYAFLYSSELEVRTGDHMKGGAGAKAEITGLANVEIGLDGGTKSGDEISAKKPVAFAVRMVRLKWADGKYELDFNRGVTLEAAAQPEPAFVPRMGTVFDIAEPERVELK